MRILFKNADILIRGENGYETLKNAYLGIENDKIVYVSLKAPEDSYEVIKDYSNKLLMPGLVNGHGHAAMTILRGVGSGLPLQEWLNDAIFPIEAKLTPNDVYVGTKLACLEMIASGTTTFSDMYDFPYSVALAVAESGIKTNCCRTGLCTDFLPISSPRFKETVSVAATLSGDVKVDEECERELKTKEFPKVLEAAIKDGRVRGDLSYHSEYLTTEEFVKGLSDENKKLNVCIQMHASETEKEVNACKERHNGLTPIEYFEKNGVFDNGNAYLAHCVHATENDLDIMAKTHTSLISNPSSNMKLASGFAPIRKALDKGVNVGLGTDGCASNNNLDMFEEMHILALIQSGINKDPTNLSASEIIDMATVGSAKAMHRYDIGKIEVGYKADIIALDLNKPHLIPNLDSASLIVYSAHGSDVSMTMVDGKILYEDGKFLSLDKEQIVKETEEIVKRLYN